VTFSQHLKMFMSVVEASSSTATAHREIADLTGSKSTLGVVTREVRVRADQSALPGTVDQSSVVRVMPVFYHVGPRPDSVRTPRRLTRRQVRSRSVCSLDPFIRFLLILFLSKMMREAIPSSASNHCSYLKLF
jgi:hypothetical protein